ncbi:MAG: hypothetical protein ACRC7N_12545 [Clostridium sp.]
MKTEILLKGKKDPIIFVGDKIEILDLVLNDTCYKQVRIFRNGFSKSEYINKNLIKTIRERK